MLLVWNYDNFIPSLIASKLVSVSSAAKLVKSLLSYMQPTH